MRTSNFEHFTQMCISFVSLLVIVSLTKYFNANVSQTVAIAAFLETYRLSLNVFQLERKLDEQQKKHQRDSNKMENMRQSIDK